MQGQRTYANDSQLCALALQAVHSNGLPLQLALHPAAYRITSHLTDIAGCFNASSTCDPFGGQCAASFPHLWAVIAL